MPARWLGSIALLFCLTLSADAARALNFAGPDFHLNFTSPATHIMIQQQIVGPGIVGPGIVGPGKVETVAITICTEQSLRTTFTTTSSQGAEAAQGYALAAILGYMQGLSTDDIVAVFAKIPGIVGPGIVGPGIVGPGFVAFGSDHVAAVSAQIESALQHIALDEGGKSPALDAYNAASSALGAATSCGSANLTSGSVSSGF